MKRMHDGAEPQPLLDVVRDNKLFTLLTLILGIFYIYLLYLLWPDVSTALTVPATLAATGSVFYLAKQVKTTIEEGRIQRTYDLIKRYNDPIFGRMLSDSISYIIKLKDDEDKLREFATRPLEDRELKILYQSIGICFNFFEEIGQLYNHDLLYDHVMDEFFGSTSLYYYEKSEDYIKIRMELRGNKSDLYREWRTMNNAFKNKGIKA